MTEDELQQKLDIDRSMIEKLVEIADRDPMMFHSRSAQERSRRHSAEANKRLVDLLEKRRRWLKTQH